MCKRWILNVYINKSKMVFDRNISVSINFEYPFKVRVNSQTNVKYAWRKMEEVHHFRDIGISKEYLGSDVCKLGPIQNSG